MIVLGAAHKSKGYNTPMIGIRYSVKGAEITVSHDELYDIFCVMNDTHFPVY